MLSDKARKLGSEPAFPYAVREDTEAWSGGMTIRMEFAKTFMGHLIQADGRYQFMAKCALDCADALLEALVKGEG